MATFTPVRNKSQTRGAMKGVCGYVSQEKKIRFGDREYLIGSNCVAESAYTEMMMTKEQFHKTDGRQFYHFVQSFAEGDNITPDEANAIGYEFAQKVFPDFEVLIATHSDTEHTHNHMVVNSVSFRDGRKFHSCPEDLRAFRIANDEICLAHGLSVLESPTAEKMKQKRAKGLSAREYRSAEKGESWKFELMNQINSAMSHAATRDEFLEEMENEGYEVKWKDEYKYITYTTPEGRRCRDRSLHDDKYLKERMEHEFRIREEIAYGRTAQKKSDSQQKTAADAGTASDRRGMEQPPVIPSGDADGSGISAAGDEWDERERELKERLLLADDRTGDENAEQEPAGDHTGYTGWEKEREILFASEPVLGMGEMGSHGLGNPTGALSVLVRLGKSVEHSQPSVPIRDATTMATPKDSKALAKEHEKKVALGHKENDHEDEEMNMKMKMSY